MADLNLTAAYTSNETSIPNLFLDTFMPAASGEFVKVYLCLLRMFADARHKATLSDIADKLNHTESDVIRAIRYWEKAGLMSVDYNGERPVSITLLPVTESAEDTSAVSVEPQQEEEWEPQCDECFKELLFVTEQLIGRPLSSTDVSTMTYIYHDLRFNAELIEYLIEYCVSNEKHSMRYVQSVAIAWHKEGITSSNEAKERHEIHNNKVYSVMRAFGLNERRPGKSELDFINKWHDTYGFDTDIIVEACNRTIANIHKPSFEYADTILGNWRRQNVHSISDIGSADAISTRKAAGAANRQETPKPARNRFNNFDQRTYDYSALEQKLLGKKEKKDET